MAFAVPLAERFDRIPKEARKVMARLLLAAGPLVSWRAFLARGDVCTSGPAPDAGACVAWEAWYRWPGVAAGLGLAVAAAAMLVLLRREAADAVGRPRRRRER